MLDALVAAWDSRPRRRALVNRLRTFAPVGAVFALLAILYLGLCAHRVWKCGVVRARNLRRRHGGGAVLAVGRISVDCLPRRGAGVLGWAPAHFRLRHPRLCLAAPSLPAERAFVSVTPAAVNLARPPSRLLCLAVLRADRGAESVLRRSSASARARRLGSAWGAAHDAGDRRSGRSPSRAHEHHPVRAAFQRLAPVQHLRVPLMRQWRPRGGTDAARFLFGLGAVAAVLLFVLVPPRLAFVTVGAVALFLALSAWSVAGTLRDQANLTRLEAGSANVSWIDDAIGTDADAPFVFTADLVANPHPLWQTEFWNRSVGDVYGLDVVDPRSFRPYGRRRRTRALRLGRRRSASTVAALRRRTTRRRHRRGEDRQHGSPRALPHSRPASHRRARRCFCRRLVWDERDLYHASAEVPFEWTSGVRAGTAPMSRAGHDRCRTPRFRPSCLVGPLGCAQRTSAFRLSTPAAPFRVKIGVGRTFSPADYGSADTRELGVQLAFAFRPTLRPGAGDPSSSIRANKPRTPTRSPRSSGGRRRARRARPRSGSATTGSPTH